MMPRLKLALFLGIAALSIALVPAVPSTVSAADIFACTNKQGNPRIVAANTTCKTTETLLQWPSVDDDTLGDLTCAAGQTVKFNGTA